MLSFLNSKWALRINGRYTAERGHHPVLVRRRDCHANDSFGVLLLYEVLMNESLYMELQATVRFSALCYRTYTLIPSMKFSSGLPTAVPEDSAFELVDSAYSVLNARISDEQIKASTRTSSPSAQKVICTSLDALSASFPARRLLFHLDWLASCQNLIDVAITVQRGISP